MIAVLLCLFASGCRSKERLAVRVEAITPCRREGCTVKGEIKRNKRNIRRITLILTAAVIFCTGCGTDTPSDGNETNPYSATSGDIYDGAEAQVETVYVTNVAG